MSNESITEEILLSTQPMRQQNIDALVAYFEAGCKGESHAIGIELEHHIVHSDTLSAASYYDEGGARWALEKLKAFYPIESRTAEGDLIGLARSGEAITLEPAGQIELSAGPFANMGDAQTCFSAFETILQNTLEEANTVAVLAGYHPSAIARELPLIPKPRYEYMTNYFEAISPWGIRMMRGSGSTQVSIDYKDEQDATRKMRLAHAATPLLSLITDNVTTFEGQNAPHAMMRTEIWQYTDPARCNTVPGIMDPDYTFADYARYILDVPAIVAEDGQGAFMYSTQTFGELFAHTVMDEKNIQHALSMVFPDVRLKRYIEIRPGDSLPVDEAIGYAALIKGLFTFEESLATLDNFFLRIDEEAINQAKENCMMNGYEANVYGYRSSALCKMLFRTARAALGDEAMYLDPLEERFNRLSE